MPKAFLTKWEPIDLLKIGHRKNLTSQDRLPDFQVSIHSWGHEQNNKWDTTYIDQIDIYIYRRS